MNAEQEKILLLTTQAAERGCLRKLVLSQPINK